jgi:SAM-dependent methyltransferase
MAFYGEVYRPLVSAYHGRVIDAESIQPEQREYAEELIRLLRPHLSAHPRDLLDIGGSTGVVAKAFVDELGVGGTVLDPSPEELSVAAESGLEAIHGFAESFETHGRRWDVILLCQAIDHLLDVAGSLSRIWNALADDGRAFVDILDFALAIDRVGAVEDAIKIDHPYYLTDATARAYLRVAGLDVLDTRVSHDGHRGYVLRRGTSRTPEWTKVRGAAALRVVGGRDEARG